jgi:hypothetical protein
VLKNLDHLKTLCGTPGGISYIQFLYLKKILIFVLFIKYLFLGMGINQKP